MIFRKERFPIFIFIAINDIVTSNNVGVSLFDELKIVEAPSCVFLLKSSLFWGCTKNKSMLNRWSRTPKLVYILLEVMVPCLHIG